jgi:hypothetical protein
MSFSKFDLNAQQCNRILREAQKIKFTNIFPEHLNNILIREAYV